MHCTLWILYSSFRLARMAQTSRVRSALLGREAEERIFQ